MANKTVKTRVQNKHDIEANWKNASFAPLAGELIVYDPDSTYSYSRFKIGDGKTAIGSLPFLHTLRTAGDITVNSSTGVVTVNDDSHNHVISNVDGLQAKLDDIDAAIAAKAPNSHTHDDRYYTESEVNTKLSDKVSKSDTAVQCVAGGLIVGKTSTTGVSGTGQGRIMFTGQTNPLIGVQAIAADGTVKTPYYIQAIAGDDSFCIGPTSAKALSFDADGNMTSPVNLTIKGTITEGTQTLANKYAPKSHTHSYIPTSQKGTASGVAELDSSGKVPASQLPSYVDDVLEYSAKASFPATGETGKIYVDTGTNKTYRWSGSAYVEISASLALGETSSTAYRGDRGKTAYTHSQAAHAPSNAQKNSDITKAEIEAKLTGNVTTHTHSYDPAGSASAVQTNLNSHTGNKSNPHGVTCSQISALPVGNVAGTTGYHTKITGTNKVGNSLISDNGSVTTVHSRLVVEGNGSSYNEGIRVLPAANKWSNIYFSANSNTTGNEDGGWLIGRRGAAGAKRGAEGEFTIEYDHSDGRGLTLHQNGDATIYGSSFRIANQKASMQYDSTNECINFVFG